MVATGAGGRAGWDRVSPTGAGALAARTARSSSRSTTAGRTACRRTAVCSHRPTRFGSWSPTSSHCLRRGTCRPSHGSSGAAPRALLRPRPGGRPPRAAGSVGDGGRRHRLRLAHGLPCDRRRDDRRSRRAGAARRNRRDLGWLPADAALRRLPPGGVGRPGRRDRRGRDGRSRAGRRKRDRRVRGVLRRRGAARVFAVLDAHDGAASGMGRRAGARGRRGREDRAGRRDRGRRDVRRPPRLRARMRRVGLLLAPWALCLASPARAQSAPTPARPRIGLALSGGAARGLAHIGVLRILEEAGVPVDVVAGTSMGAVVGGLYAVGYTAAQLDTIFTTQDWVALLTDPVRRRDLAFDRKLTEDQYLLTLPISRGAVHASMAVPSVFSPVEIEDHVLIDGGVVRNLPAQDARALGADVLICSDVTDPWEPRDSLTSVADVLVQAVSFRIWDSESEQRRHCDVLITPEVRAFSTFGFARAAELIARGEAAARAALPRIEAARAGASSPSPSGARAAGRRWRRPSPSS